MKCKHGSSAPNAINSLPESQGKPGRHKCAACCYDAGYRAGMANVASIIHDARVTHARKSTAARKAVGHG